MRDHSLDGGSDPVAADADADADAEEQNYQCAGCNRPKQSDYEKLPEWATPLLEVLDILTLVTTNSAIVERLWSMYNAIFVGEASASSSSHRKLAMKARFDRKHE